MFRKCHGTSVRAIFVSTGALLTPFNILLKKFGVGAAMAWEARRGAMAKIDVANAARMVAEFFCK